MIASSVIRAALREKADLVVAGRPESGPVLAALGPAHAYDKPADLDISIAGFAAALAATLQVDIHAVHCVPNAVYPLVSQRSGATFAPRSSRWASSAVAGSSTSPSATLRNRLFAMRHAICC